MQPFDYTDLLSSPFVDGGRDSRTGLDCWGLVRLCFIRCGITLPDYPIGCMETQRIYDEMEQQRPEWLPVDAQTDKYVPALVVMRLAQVVMVNHVGVYVGQGKFLHTERNKGVHIDRIDAPWWRRHIEGFYIPSKEAGRYGR